MLICDRAGTKLSARACKAAGLAARGADWVTVAQIAGYPTAGQAKQAAVAHLESERLK